LPRPKPRSKNSMRAGRDSEANQSSFRWLFPRALFAFVALPGTVAGVIPAMIVYGKSNRHGGSVAAGFGLLGLGLLLLLWCVRDFYVCGKGTLAPWQPPKHLVVVGLYRYVRNPMYLAVLTIVLGWSVVFGSAALLAVSGPACDRVSPSGCALRGTSVASAIRGRMGRIFGLGAKMGATLNAGRGRTTPVTRPELLRAVTGQHPATTHTHDENPPPKSRRCGFGCFGH
jgi:protein-S-isoprenylcysteine O-methyltransferase Ste14